MKIISWNVNGLSSLLKKNSLFDFVNTHLPDILCLQEIKCSTEKINIDDYNAYWSFAAKRGYAGTVIFSKIPAVSIINPNIDTEGRITAIELDKLYIVNIYAPNSQRDLTRLSYRLEWDEKLRAWLATLNKPVIVCGDFNVSPTELDIAEPKKHLRHPGYTIEERTSFDKLIALGYSDAFRALYPNKTMYSFWSYLGNNYKRNIGYRCDLFIIKGFNIAAVDILTALRCSDHCPVVCEVAHKN